MGKTSSYRQALLESLTDPVEAAAYLDAAMEDSQESFLKASRNVAQSRQIPMSEVASSSGVQRETLYRSLSEDGNPTLKTLRSVLNTLGLRLGVVPIVEEFETTSYPPTPASERSATRQAVEGTLLEQAIVQGYMRSIPCDSYREDFNQVRSSETEKSGSQAGAPQWQEIRSRN